MNVFEQQYYEEDYFWNDSLSDSGNRLRIKETVELIPLDVISLVDIGCGNGIFLHAVQSSKASMELLGVDRSESALRHVNVQSLRSSIHELPLPDRSFDCVSCLEVIEHLPCNIYEQALLELTRISSKYIIISVPYKEHLESSFNSCPSCKSAFSYEMHLRTFNDKQMVELLLPYGFECVSKQLLGEQKRWLGHDFYKKIMYGEQKKGFVSPICPVCGYENRQRTGDKKVNQSIAGHKSVKNTITSTISYLPKLVWPKTRSYYWVLCLFKRTT